jgi:hypothetical protein
MSLRARGRTRTAARLARCGSTDDHLFFATEDRVFEREALLNTKIAAPARPLTSPALTAPHEELGKQVLELGEDIAHSRSAEVEPRALEPSVTELVVTGALLAIG